MKQFNRIHAHDATVNSVAASSANVQVKRFGVKPSHYSGEQNRYNMSSDS